MLHAVYVVERFLENLVKRHCNFHVAFFEGNSPPSSFISLLISNPENLELCIPPGVPSTHRSRYRLAREVLRRHLTLRLATSHPDIVVNSFATLDSPNFKDYLHVSPILFVMAHDGAGRSKTLTVEPGVGDIFAKTLLRGMIWFFNTHKLNVALINRIEFRDSKVFTMIVESFTPPSKLKLSMTTKFVHQIFDARSSLAELRNEDEQGLDLLDLSADGLELDLQRFEGLSFGENLNESTYLAIYTASRFLKLETDEAFMISAFVLHRILLNHVPLSKRRLPLVTFDEEFEEQITAFLAKFSRLAEKVLKAPEWTRLVNARKVVCDTVDLIDGRMFRVAMHGMCNNSLAGDVPQSVEEDWSILSRIMRDLTGEELSLEGSLEPDFSNTLAATEEFEYKPEKLSVLPFSSPVFDKHLACIHVDTDKSIPYRVGAMKLYRETTHWHNHRKPLNAKVAPAEKVSKWRYVNSIHVSTTKG